MLALIKRRIGFSSVLMDGRDLTCKLPDGLPVQSAEY